MLPNLRDWFIKLMSGKDNSTPDLGRWSWFVCTASIISSAIFNGFNHHEIDLEKLAQGLSLVVGAHGVALWAKKDTEPNAQ